MSRILFLDVDGAPFLAHEMLSLLKRGHGIVWLGSRSIPESLKSGELEPLAACELRLPWLGREVVSALVYYIGARPLRTLVTLVTAIRSHLREPMTLVKLMATLGWTLAAARWAETHGVEHVHGNWAHLPATSAWIVSRLSGLEFSFSAHAGRDVFRTTAMLGTKIRDARFIVTCNEAARRRLIELSTREAGAKIHLCYHGVDVARFRPGQGTREEIVLSVGNLDPAKGFDLMIRALPRLLQDTLDVRYQIIGDGGERKHLEEVITALGVGASVELAGRREGAAVVSAYQSASVFVAPSRILAGGGRDGLPNVVLEAMASGIPVVGTSVAAIPEAIEHERTGLLVPSEDPEALAVAVGRLLKDAPLRERLARAAFEQITERFDRSQNVATFCDLFANVSVVARKGVSSELRREA